MRKAHIYWCPNCNVPLLKNYCAKCGGVGVKVLISSPGDCRFAFREDIKHIRLALLNETGENSFEKIVGAGKIVVLNKVRYIDFMCEVIVDGMRLGKVYYDPLLGKWRFRWCYYGAKKALEYGLAEYIKVENIKRVREGYIIKKHVDGRKEQQYIITDRSGEPIGVAYTTRIGIRVRDVFKEKDIIECSGKTATIDDVIKANIHHLRRIEGKAIIILKQITSKLNLPLIASYSGGKDSSTALHLALEAGLDPLVVYNDTGIEIPELRDFVFKQVEKLGVKVKVLEAKDAFWRNVDFYGPPAVDYRWCTVLLKLSPTSKFVREYFPMGVLCIDGRRRLESASRARETRLRRSRRIPLIISLSPIVEWNQLEEWLYIFWRKIDYCKLYELGFGRLGCYLCPNCALVEFKYVERKYPELWNKWLSKLEYWRRKLDYSEEWITLGLWRYHGPTTAMMDILSHAGRKLMSWQDKFKAYLHYISHYSRDRDILKIKFKVPLLLEKIASTLEAFNWKCKFTHGNILIAEKDYLYAKISDVGMVETNSASNILVELLSAIYQNIACRKCKLCYLWCPESAISFKDGERKINLKQCTHCMICLLVCPLASIFVRQVVVPLLEGSPKPPPLIKVDLAKYWKVKVQPYIKERKIPQIPWHILAGK